MAEPRLLVAGMIDGIVCGWRAFRPSDGGSNPRSRWPTLDRSGLHRVAPELRHADYRCDESLYSSGRSSSRIPSSAQCTLPSEVAGLFASNSDEPGRAGTSIGQPRTLGPPLTERPGKYAQLVRTTALHHARQSTSQRRLAQSARVLAFRHENAALHIQAFSRVVRFARGVAIFALARSPATISGPATPVITDLNPAGPLPSSARRSTTRPVHASEPTSSAWKVLWKPERSITLQGGTAPWSHHD